MPLQLPLTYHNITKRSFIKFAFPACLAFAGLAGCALLARDEPEAEPAPLTFVAAAKVRDDVAAESGITGIVQSEHPAMVGAVSSGRIVQLRKQIGDTVMAGEVLAIIDGKVAGLRSAQAEAEVRRAAALAGERAAAAERANGLLATGAIAQAERDVTKAEAAAAANLLASARAAAAVTKAEADQNIIRAPASGIITARLLEVGAVTAPGQQIYSIEARKGGMILAAIPAKLANAVRPGMRVTYEAEGVTGSARVVGASSRIESGGVLPVRLVIESGAPSPGAIVRLRLSSNDASSAMVRVPVTSLQTDQQGRRIVYQINAKGQAMPVPVVLHSLSGGDARIMAPLPAGTTIVAAGGSFLLPGQSVRIAKPAA